MNKTAIKNFATGARTELLSKVRQRAMYYGITEDGHTPMDGRVLGGLVLSDSEISQRKSLIEQIDAKGFASVMDEAAYTWFNRFIALRFMEVNGYLPSRVRVFTNEQNEFKPAILQEALHIELPGLRRERVLALMDAADSEALYKYLLITQCNALHDPLPEMFEQIGGHLELLFPDYQLRPDSVIGKLISDIPERDFLVRTAQDEDKIRKGELADEDAPAGQVEILGWLYQYYITELNELVYDGTLSSAKISKELLPAATQLFTPDWPIRYMVENSLGLLWIERLKSSYGYTYETNVPLRGNNGDRVADALTSKWKYFLDDVELTEQEELPLEDIRATYRDMSPEDIKFIDPCMGSGHILVYAFDVLMQIYTSAGYSERDAAALIVEKNLYGLDIDDRASQLAYFAVMMKARQYDRRFLTRGIQPHVFAIQESNSIDRRMLAHFCAGLSDAERKQAKQQMERLLDIFIDAKEYGSILKVDRLDWTLLCRYVDQVELSGQQAMEHLYLEKAKQASNALISIASLLSQRYDVVVTNPPYLGSARFSPKLASYVNANYPDVKADLAMVMFQSAIQRLLKQNGFISFITTSSWMFLKSFEKIRSHVISDMQFESIVDYGTELFDGKVGHNPIVSWVSRAAKPFKKVTAIRLVDYCYARRDEKPLEFFEPRNRYHTAQTNFTKIPGSPVAYWASEVVLSAFTSSVLLGEIGSPKVGLQTGDNDTFLRLWHEVTLNRIGFACKNCEESVCSGRKWFPYNKGGEFRKWYGNNDCVVNWENDGSLIRSFVDSKGKLRSRPQNIDYFFRASITWSKISSGSIAFRYKPSGYVFDVAGTSVFSSDEKLRYLLAFCNSKVALVIAALLSPTLNYEVGHISSFPIIHDMSYDIQVGSIVTENIEVSKNDWDSFETSWDFRKQPLI